jgi:hypothetical protein
MRRSAFLCGIGRPVMLAAVLLGVSVPSRAEEPLSNSRDGWQVSLQGPYGFTSGGKQDSFYFQATPGTAFTSSNATQSFTDLSVTHPLGIPRDLGLGDVRATIGARFSDPPSQSSLTSGLDQRRYFGIGPRVGLQGSKPLESSWVVDWQVGTAFLFNDRAPDYAGVQNFSLPSGGSLVNVDGLLGLSYWFDAASKLTLGYRADAYLKSSGNNSVGVPATPDRIDHGPVVRFTIRK